MKYFFTVGEFDGTLAEFLLSQGVSSRILTSLRKKPGLMLVNGKVAFSDCLVKTGDEVTIDIIDKTADHEPYFEQQVKIAVCRKSRKRYYRLVARSLIYSL